MTSANLSNAERDSLISNATHLVGRPIECNDVSNTCRRTRSSAQLLPKRGASSRAPKPSAKTPPRSLVPAPHTRHTGTLGMSMVSQSDVLVGSRPMLASLYNAIPNPA
jgi:hypothetical protein